MVHRPAFSDGILEFFADRDTKTVEIPVLQPADPFLDTAGEDLRRRIFLTQNELGDMLCLRPEFTIPVCLSHIETAAGTPQRYCYLGEVFRQRRDGETEFFQAGIEDLGNEAFAEADARAVSEAIETLAHLLPADALQVTLGDQTVFEAVVEALGLPEGWQTRLIRAFGDAAQIDLLLQNLAGERPAAEGLDQDLAEYVRSGDVAGLTDLIDQRMEETGFLSNASRSPAEIAERLVEKARLSATHLDPKALDILKTFLALNASLDEAGGSLAAFSRIAGIDLSEALGIFESRVAALKEKGDRADAIRYRAAFGRPLDYYTGLVFEISVRGSVLAGGGRFDRLLTLLGAPKPIPAVGFSLWLDRIETAMKGGAQ